jgi:putative tricarboxylic transport membrane protein
VTTLRLPSGSRLAEAAVGAGVALLGIAMAAATAALPVLASYAKVGPRLFPGLIAGGLCLFGLLMLRSALARPDTAEKGASFAIDPGPLAWVAAGLALQVPLLPWIGFIPSVTILFVLTARGFDSRRPWPDVAVGLVLAVAVRIGFGLGLGLRLPDGPFGQIF